MAQNSSLTVRALFTVSMMSFIVCCVPTASTNDVSGAQDLSIATYRDADAYAIYALFLRGANHAHPVVQAETDYDRNATLKSIGITGDADFRKVWGTTLRDYVTRYRIPMLLAPDASSKISYELLPLAGFRAMVKSPGGWDNFYSRYPDSGGYVSFSAVGFDSAREHALAYMGIGCGMLCGFWGPHFFEKMDGKWTEVSVTANYFNMVS
jgi:hypothetical protein